MNNETNDEFNSYRNYIFLQELKKALFEIIDEIKYIHPYKLFDKEEFNKELNNLTINELEQIKKHFIEMEWYEDIVNIDNVIKSKND